MTTRAVVLGSGMVGRVIALDLAAEGWAVTAADARDESLSRLSDEAARAGVRVSGVRADLSSSAEIGRLAGGADVVLGALPSHLGFMALRTLLEARKPYCDISFMPEDALELDGLARKAGTTAVVDCGVAPGISNLLAAHEAGAMRKPERIAIYVGGLPRERRLPFQYKAGFAPADVIEEYTRPARLVEHGQVVVREALTEPEPVEVPGLGTLEAVNTDGLRSLATTLRVPNMVEKTLRYPGHYDLMRAFRAAGLFGKEEIVVGGARVRPLDVTSALLFPKWTYGPGEEDLTAMKIEVEGDGERVSWDLLDYYDRERGWTSMAKTTALPCTIAARMLMAGRIAGPGVLPPELFAGQRGVVDEMLRELSRKGVRYERRAARVGA